MRLIKMKGRRITAVVVMAGTLNLASCGYFMYPERVGQTGGRLDPAVVVLDALGLFIGIIPGVVAFAVDIATGTIYLSPGQKSVIEKHRERAAYIDAENPQAALGMEEVPAGALPVDPAILAERLAEMLGHPVEAGDIHFYRATQSQKLALLNGSHTIL